MSASSYSTHCWGEGVGRVCDRDETDGHESLSPEVPFSRRGTPTEDRGSPLRSSDEKGYLTDRRYTKGHFVSVLWRIRETGWDPKTEGRVWVFSLY